MQASYRGKEFFLDWKKKEVEEGGAVSNPVPPQGSPVVHPRGSRGPLTVSERMFHLPLHFGVIQGVRITHGRTTEEPQRTARGYTWAYLKGCTRAFVLVCDDVSTRRRLVNIVLCGVQWPPGFCFFHCTMCTSPTLFFYKPKGIHSYNNAQSPPITPPIFFIYRSDVYPQNGLSDCMVEGPPRCTRSTKGTLFIWC